ncbi:MAG: DeoR family transcriptional regulator [Clostridia bacterium]|nr:DeoR family transcriptional regulator [Clostridia bacterium]MCI8979921.1 DeoR family transcriptional regulator [Clostridia bacterium]
MSDKLCVCDRRMKILDLLRVHRQMTRCDLAREFNVTIRTITRDILYLSHIAPITVKHGCKGGICLETEFRQYSLYLTEKEECCLYSLLDNLDEERKSTVESIIVKFTKNMAYENQNIK